jgi:hypothetical protein
MLSPRPPSVEAFRVQHPEPARPPAAAAPARAPAAAPPRAPAAAPPRPPAVQPPRLPALPAAHSAAPAYKPPTMMPFFNQPIVPAQPGLFGRLTRWLMMIALSSILGAALGAAIWYQFLRQP